MHEKFKPKTNKIVFFLVPLYRSSFPLINHMYIYLRISHLSPVKLCFVVTLICSLFWFPWKHELKKRKERNQFLSMSVVPFPDFHLPCISVPNHRWRYPEEHDADYVLTPQSQADPLEG